MDWYKHDIGAYRRNTSQLTPLQHGIYRTLLDEYYYLGGALPDDLKWTYRTCNAVNKSERAAVHHVLATFFPKNGDGFRHNDRADQEIQQYQARCETNRTIARQRNVHESSTNRSPIHTDIERKKEREGQKPVDKSLGQHLKHAGFLYRKPDDLTS